LPGGPLAESEIQVGGNSRWTGSQPKEYIWCSMVNSRALGTNSLSLNHQTLGGLGHRSKLGFPNP